MSVEHRPTARLIKLLQFPQICILVETRFGLSYFTSERTCDILRPKMRLPSCQVLPGCDLRHCNITSRFLVNHRSLRGFRKKVAINQRLVMNIIISVLSLSLSCLQCVYSSLLFWPKSSRVIILCLGDCEFVDSCCRDAFCIYLDVQPDVKCRNVGRRQEKEVFYNTLISSLFQPSRNSKLFSVVKDRMSSWIPPLCLDNGGS